MHACLRSHCVAAWRRWPHGPTRRVARTDRRAPDTCCCCARNTAGSVRWRLRETKSRASERERERARGNGAPDQVRRHALCDDAAARQRNGVSQHHLRLPSAQDGVLQRAKGLCSPTLSPVGLRANGAVLRLLPRLCSADRSCRSYCFCHYLRSPLAAEPRPPNARPAVPAAREPPPPPRARAALQAARPRGADPHA